jgi:nucleoside-diphosphate-sugar epimerase
MSVLITGGAGFIGSYVVRELINAGETVIAYDSQISGNALDDVLSKAQRAMVHVVEGDVTDGAKIRRVIDNYEIDAVAHLASPLSSQTEADAELAIRNMITAQQVILKIARAAKLRKVVWASSTGVFGERERYTVLPLPNDAPHYPTYLYGACKSFNEYLSGYLSERYDLDTLGLRFPTVYGVGRRRGIAMFLSDIIAKPALGKLCRVPMADAVYNWMYVVDAAALVVKALRTKRTQTRIFNVSSEVAPIRRVVEIIREWLPDALFEFEPGEYPIVAEIDSSVLKHEVDFTPQWTLRMALYESINIVRDQAGLQPLAEVNGALSTKGVLNA